MDVPANIIFLISQRNLKELARYLELLELQSHVCFFPDDLQSSIAAFSLNSFPDSNAYRSQLNHPSLTPFDAPLYALLFATYLGLDDLDAARFLAKRIQLQSPEINVLLECLAHLWSRDVAAFYATISSVSGTDGVWCPIVAAVVEIAVNRVRERGVKLLETAYTSIAVADALVYLGLDKNDLELLVKRGWTVSENGLFVKPVRLVGPTKTLGDGPGLSQIEALTSVVVHLEAK
ncbi:hypothetical protein HK096_008630 [Nowakowskiella sp. JEL0078]|nr:hypothetical protein HK096_008630 [Nowakowskiella sp. JEL0078]